MAFERHLAVEDLMDQHTWINISVNFFLGRYHETKMGGALEIISCAKI